MRIFRAQTLGGKDLILEYIMSLTKSEIIDGLSVLEAFKQDKLDSLILKPWQGKVWEVYFYKHNRIFYVVLEGGNCYMLHACRKQKNKTEATDKDTIIKRAKDLGAALSIKII